jgi:response regulator RpfG family c-di-GMP phosphodiesterase
MENDRGSGGIHDELEGLADLASRRSSDTIVSTLAAAREHLGMEVAFVSSFTEGGQQEFLTLEGDGDAFSLKEGEGIPLEDSPCTPMVAGRVPNVVPDVRQERRIKDLAAVREAGVGAYVGVPLRFSDGRLYGTMCCLSRSPEPSLNERDASFMRVLARLVAEQLEREELEEEKRRLEAETTGVGALLAALEARDGYTGEHSRTVVELSAAVARRLGLSEAEVWDVERAAMLHDIGKLGVPDAVLRKPGPLSEEEWTWMRRHPEIGERIVASVNSLTHLASVVRAEHERWDGAGYPDGLSQEEIPQASRIVFACDAFHAMTSDRPYRRAIGTTRALEELRENAGAQFCPRAVRALLEVVEEPNLTSPRGRADVG